jgi:hypothetical protein
MPDGDNRRSLKHHAASDLLALRDVCRQSLLPASTMQRLIGEMSLIVDDPRERVRNRLAALKLILQAENLIMARLHALHDEKETSSGSGVQIMVFLPDNGRGPELPESMPANLRQITEITTAD